VMEMFEDSWMLDKLIFHLKIWFTSIKSL
jgi:hypothetical protein